MHTTYAIKGIIIPCATLKKISFHVELFILKIALQNFDKIEKIKIQDEQFN
jgi:hypothetical protein